MTTYRISFAPLQGHTDSFYRNAFDRIFGGVSEYYTPFIRIERGGLRKRDILGLDPENNDLRVKLVPQIIASEKDETAQLMETVLSYGYKEVNLNIGCPFPMITKKGKGAGILPHPDKVDEILSETKKFSGIEISVKMRLGMESPNECLALLPVLQKHSICKVIMHPRIGKQQYKGDLDMESFSVFYSKCDIPIIFNGDIKTPKDVENIYNKYPNIEGVMIGRGLLSHPELAKEIGEGKRMSLDEKLSKYKELHDEVFDAYMSHLNGGDPQMLSKMKEFWEYFYPEYDKKRLKLIKKATNLQKYLDAISF